MKGIRKILHLIFIDKNTTAYREENRENFYKHGLSNDKGNAFTFPLWEGKSAAVRKIYISISISKCPIQITSVGSGRIASSLRRRYFGRYQNVLRIILIDVASLVTAPKEASLQRLVFGFS
ncbi:MAG: hypothetical protein V4557_01185 [Bacteroidota bacterium]